jgi:hypothetical protein
MKFAEALKELDSSLDSKGLKIRGMKSLRSAILALIESFEINLNLFY